MKNLKLLITVLSFLTLNSNAQENKEKPPKSIYTFTLFQENPNSFSSLNKKLSLFNFDFVYANQRDLDNNTFSFLFKNIGKKPSKFIYDDYKRYQERNLLKGFLLKNDPTRWNLHRVKNTL